MRSFRVGHALLRAFNRLNRVSTPSSARHLVISSARVTVCTAILLATCSIAVAQPSVTVGSKKFTESYVLGEIAKKLLTDAGYKVEHKQGVGATAIVWEALKSGEIAAYPEYTGTISEEILKEPGISNDEIASELRKLGIGMTGEIGFNNTYALVMRRKQAEELRIKTIGDLKNHPDLRVKVSHEFLDRKDGWNPLVQRYGISMKSVGGIDHGIAYRALSSDQIDVTDAYSTDAQIGTLDLYTLVDDLGFFPKYRAVFLYKLDMPDQAVNALKRAEGRINEAFMIKMNARAEETQDFAGAASLFFAQAVEKESLSSQTIRLGKEHLELVGKSMFFAILVGLVLGIVASRGGPMGAGILGLTGVLQTIPGLALLVMLVPLMGIDQRTAILALFLYSLLPIVRNTAAGLQGIPKNIRESAQALGLPAIHRLWKVYLPMASRTILAGIKTSAIINVGTATLAALIGAGGFGEPIVSGLAVNSNSKILEGAIPAAILALLIQLLFDLLDRVVIPKGLRT